MTLGWLMDKEVSRCVCVGSAAPLWSARSGAWWGQGLLAALRLGPSIWDAEAPRAALGVAGYGVMP